MRVGGISYEDRNKKLECCPDFQVRGERFIVENNTCGLDRGHIDVVQPDVGRVGGITEAMRVVQMAHDRGKVVIPHCWKSGISIAALSMWQLHHPTALL